jgi:hypothetical protein
MSLSEIIIKLIGLALAIVGFCLILTLVHISLFGVALDPEWLAVVVGVVMLGAGIWIIRGGSVSL